MTVMNPEDLINALELKIKELEIERQKIDMHITSLKQQQEKAKKLAEMQKQRQEAKPSLLKWFR